MTGFRSNRLAAAAWIAATVFALPAWAQGAGPLDIVPQPRRAPAVEAEQAPAEAPLPAVEQQPPAEPGAAATEVEVATVETLDPEAAGVYDEADGGFGVDMWRGTSRALVERMAGTLIHRGPDQEGFHVEGAVGLGFRRLAVIDLLTGDQPMYHADGTIVVVFNGEIYNFRELRAVLEAQGYRFITQRDT